MISKLNHNAFYSIVTIIYLNIDEELVRFPSWIKWCLVYKDKTVIIENLKLLSWSSLCAWKDWHAQFWFNVELTFIFFQLCKFTFRPKNENTGKETNLNVSFYDFYILPFFDFRICCVSQCIIWIIFKGYTCSGIPLCMFFRKTLDN